MTTVDVDWLAATPLPALRTALAAVPLGDADAVAALARPLLEDTAWLDRLIAALVAQASQDPAFRPPLPAFDSGVQTGLLLFGDIRLAIFLGCGARDWLAAKRMGTRAGAIVVPGTLGLVRALRGGAARLSLWEGGWHDGAIRPAARAIGTRRLIDGETIAIDGRTTGFVVEHAAADMVLLQATIYAGASPTLCEYDATTLALGGTGAALDGASRSQLLATLLAEIGHDDPEAFAAASRRAEPFARWSAMRMWTAAQPEAARTRLVEMAADDPDAELRDLAGATLALIDRAEGDRCPG